LTLAPAWAQNVDDRIKLLEDELTKLKAEQKQLQAEQIELRKEGAAEAAKMPTISRRAGQGVLIEAADKSWSLRTHFRFHLHSLFRDGRSNFALDGSNAREGAGEVFARRIRPTWYFCINDCFYEGEVSLDIDGMGTGSGHANRFHGLTDGEDGADGVNGDVMQRATAFIHFEQIHPWLPTFYFGADAPSAISTYGQASSNTSFQLDYDLLRRSNYNTGSMANGYGLDWRDLPVGPGSLNVVYALGYVGASADGGAVASDLKDHVLYVQYLPFNKTKNKWLSGLGVEWGGWWCNKDENEYEGCDELRIRETDGSARQDTFRANGITNHFYWNAGLGWRVGPYFLRAIYSKQSFEDTTLRARLWMIANELMIYSPKGFLTGSYSTPGTLYGGWSFERADAKCGFRVGGADEPGECNNGTGAAAYNSNHTILRNLGIFYVLAPGLNVGVSWLWYDASKLTNAAQERLECRKTAVPQKGCDWHNVIAAFRWQF
jgi:hypothetical protein